MNSCSGWEYIATLPPGVGAAIAEGPDCVAIATAGRVLRRDEDGWTPLGPPLAAVWALAWRRNQLWAAGATGLYVLDVAADEWVVKLGVANCTSLVAQPDGVIVVGTVDDGIVRSMDDGRTWHGASGGLTDFEVRELVAIGSDVVALTATGIQRTTRGGAWKTVPLPTDSVETMALVGDSLVIVKDRALWILAPSGDTWNRRDLPPSAQNPLLSLWQEADQSTEVLFGSSLLAIRAGNMNYLSEEGLEVHSRDGSRARFALPSDGVGRLVVRATREWEWTPLLGSAMITTDAGVTWTPAALENTSDRVEGLPAPLRELHVLGTHGYVAVVERTRDEGRWTAVVRAIDAHGPWHPVMSSTAASPLVVTVIDDGLLIAVGSRVFWTPMASGGRPTEVGTVASDEGEVMVLGLASRRGVVLAATTDGVWSSLDGGHEWNRQAGVDGIVTEIVSGLEEDVAVGAAGAIWRRSSSSTLARVTA